MMMSDDEKILRKILDSFSERPLNYDVLVLMLLDMKAWHQTDMSRTRRAIGTELEPLTMKPAEQAVSILCKQLEETEALFRALNAGARPSLEAPKANVDASAHQIRIRRSSGDASSSVEGRNIAIDLAPEILKWLRIETEKTAIELVRGQKTFKQIDEFDLWMLAMVCQKAGITCSYSDGTPFHRLASWLLGQSDPRRIISKTIKQHPQLKGKKDKISK